MSDFSIDTDFGGMPPRDMRRASERREYAAYFALIFLAALPLACLAWMLSVLRHFRLPAAGPIRTALSQAGTIAPLIFSA